MPFATFSDLPAELRNRIYTLAVEDDNTSGIVKLTTQYREPALLRVNRQIRQEAFGIFADMMLFEGEISNIIRFLNALSDEKLKWLKTVHVLVFAQRGDLKKIRWLNSVAMQLVNVYQHGRGVLKMDAIQFPINVQGRIMWVHWQNVNEFEAKLGGGIVRKTTPEN